MFAKHVIRYEHSKYLHKSLNIVRYQNRGTKIIGTSHATSTLDGHVSETIGPGFPVSP